MVLDFERSFEVTKTRSDSGIVDIVKHSLEQGPAVQLISTLHRNDHLNTFLSISGFRELFWSPESSDCAEIWDVFLRRKLGSSGVDVFFCFLNEGWKDGNGKSAFLRDNFEVLDFTERIRPRSHPERLLNSSTFHSPIHRLDSFFA